MDPTPDNIPASERDSGSLLMLAQELVGTWREIWRARLSIIAIEVATSAEALALMLAFAVAAGAVAAMTWGIALALIFHWVVARGASALTAGMVVLLVNLGACCLLVVLARRAARRMRCGAGALHGAAPGAEAP